MTLTKLNLPNDHEARLGVARNVSVWLLGYGSWADLFIAAYYDPEGAQKRLKEEMANVS